MSHLQKIYDPRGHAPRPDRGPEQLLGSTPTSDQVVVDENGAGVDESNVIQVSDDEVE